MMHRGDIGGEADTASGKPQGPPVTGGPGGSQLDIGKTGRKLLIGAAAAAAGALLVYRWRAIVSGKAVVVV